MPFELLAESFSRYGTGTITGSIFDNFVSRYTFASGSGLILQAGRNGTGLRVNSGGSFGKALKHSATWTSGFAYKLSGIQSNNAIYAIQNNDANLFVLTADTDGTLSMRSGTNFSETFATSTRSLLEEKWYYIEVTVSFSGSTPVTTTAELRINGQVQASGSRVTSFNANQLLSGDATANFHVFAGLNGAANGFTLDDLYIKNSANYYGDIRIIAIYPDGDGATLDWTPISGTDHYLMVNSHPVDLSKYLYTLTPGDIDTWDWQNVPGFSGTIKAVNISMDARKDDEGTKSFEIVVGNTGTEANSDEFFVSDLTPEYYEFSLEEDPATSLPWTQAGFNAKQFGIKLIS